MNALFIHVGITYLTWVQGKMEFCFYSGGVGDEGVGEQNSILG